VAIIIATALESLVALIKIINAGYEPKQC